MKTEKETKPENFINISNRWIGRDKNSIRHLTTTFNSTDYFHMCMLILCRHLRWKESRFTVQEIQRWFYVDRRYALSKISVLDGLQEDKYIKYSFGLKDHIIIEDLSDVFYPTDNFTQITETEINTMMDYCDSIEGKKTKQVNFKNLLITYYTIKSYMRSGEWICYPSEESIKRDIDKISSTSVCDCIKALRDMKLLSCINRGYNKATKRNLGNVYTLYSQDAEQRLEDYIRNEFQHT